jgi:hypothetical protein
MTFDEFRAHEGNRNDLAAMLRSPVLANAMIAVIDQAEQTNKVTLHDPEIASVRALELIRGYKDFARKLHELTLPNPLLANEPEAAFGEDEAMRKLRELSNQN